MPTPAKRYDCLARTWVRSGQTGSEPSSPAATGPTLGAVVAGQAGRTARNERPDIRSERQPRVVPALRQALDLPSTSSGQDGLGWNSSPKSVRAHRRSLPTDVTKTLWRLPESL